MAYSPPSLKVYQEFVPQIAANALPLYACIVAPQYGLHRFDVEDEQALLGAYDVGSGNSYSAWPGKAAGSVLDVASSKLWFQDAVLRYHLFSLTGGAGDGVTVDGGNRIRSSGLVFKTANGYSRSGAFGTRDVAVGDYVKVTYGATVRQTKVAGFVADAVAATVGAVSAASTNHAATTVNASVTEFIASPEFAVAGSAASYDGLADGDVEEVYTVTVTQTDGSVRNTLVSVVSASGNDDVVDQVLSASGVPTACGLRGATFTVTASPALASTSSSSLNSASSVSDTSASGESKSSQSSNIDRQLVVGDYWVVSVRMAYTKPVPVSGGSYAGARNTTYLMAVTEGGTVGASTVKLQPTTTNGYDSGLELTVAGAGALALGNYGVTFTVAGGQQYVKGDVFLVVVTAAADGPVKTLVLNDKLTGSLTSTALAVVMGLYDTFLAEPGDWTATAALITVAAGATKNGTYLGVPQSFPILLGDLYIEYRELLQANVSTIGSLDATTDVEDTLGPVHPDNPLAMMTYTALLGSQGTPVYYLGIETDDEAGYANALEVLTEVPEAYGLVPYDTSRAIADRFQAHVNDMSSPDRSLFRILWRGLDIERVYAVYTELSGGGEILATVTGTQLLASGAAFVTAGVEAGDTVRINYRLDGTGNTIYDSYTVDGVVAEDELRLLSAAPAPIVVPIKTEVWRTASLAQYAANIAAEAIHHSDRRVTTVWSDRLAMLAYDDLSKAYLCALLAGMRSAGAPHQPMSRVEIDYATLTATVPFGTSQLNVMGAAGVWLVVQDVDGQVYTRHQLTTDNSDVFHAEQSVTTNYDHIVRDYRSAVSDLYGCGNVSDAMLRLIDGRVDRVTFTILGRTYPSQIGPQLESITITRLEVDPVLRDQVWLEADVVLPVPMNHLIMKFRLL